MDIVRKKDFLRHRWSKVKGLAAKLRKTKELTSAEVIEIVEEISRAENAAWN